MSGSKCLFLFALCSLFIIPGHSMAGNKIKTEFGDSTKTHVFTLKAQLLTRGEYREGAMPNENETRADNRSQSHWAYLMVVFTPNLLTVRF